MAKVRKDLAFVEAAALTDTVKDAAKIVPAEMDRQIDRPTKFTRDSVRIIPAKKTRLVAGVAIKDIQARYLHWIYRGGTRKPKRRAIVVPVKASRNKHGNLTRRYMQKQLAKPNTFSGRVGKVAGLWQRMRNGRLKLLVAYEAKATYEKSFDPGPAIFRCARRRFPVYYKRRFDAQFRKLK